MKKRTIDIRIDADGAMHIDADGFTDGACLDALDELLEGFVESQDITRKADDARPGARRRANRHQTTGSTK